ncbi:Hep/Hag repeat protein [Fusobacterium gonidiaformans 3-1-5R]|uniref:Hep/Hag repeat protein n=3 Tax=Fusobacterium TaxID=848 RepID=E5BIH2_9FUSO|nr:Hep/Hag repeat protein [Fusobacterium gonidiaformans 3-1-5R]
MEGSNMLEEKSVKHWLKRKVKFTEALLVAFLITGGIGYAADNGAGSGTGVAIGTGSNAQRDGVVAIGRGAHTNYAGGSGYSEVNGDVAIGLNATTHSYYDQSGSVAIGKNSYVENTVGIQEKLFAFKQTPFNSWGFGSLPQEPDKVVTGVAIGDNTYVRTGGTMVGSHNYRGKIGDITVSTDEYKTKRITGLGIYSTTLGANSFTNGTVATTSGALNVISSDYDGNDATKATKNFGATITGSLNSIESATSSNNVSGLANAVVGTANRTNNSNGSLIFGAGNEITNSIANVKTDAITGSAFGGPDSITSMSEKVRKLVKDSESAGSTMAFGGGNKADWTQLTAMIGVNNTITGESGKIAKLNMVNGYKNTVTNANNNIIMGNEHTSTKDNNIMIGGLSKADTRNVANTVSVGYDAKVTVEGGVALGHQSVAAVDKGKAGFDITKNTASTDENATWKATHAALSVGDVEKKVTRQITGVAAGTEDTDAVNVAQLKKVKDSINTAVENSKIHYYSVNDDNNHVENYNNDGAKAKNAVVIGIGSTSNGVNSTVLGNDIKLTGDKNGRNNSIVVGHHIEADGTHNAIFATDYNNDDNKTTHVFGEQNTVLGVGNLVGWTAEKDPSDATNTKWIYTKNTSGSDQNTVVGMNNTVNTNGNTVLGSSNEIRNNGSVISIGSGNVVGGTIINESGNEEGVGLRSGVFGHDSSVSHNEAFVFGNESKATAMEAYVLGNSSENTGKNSIVLGNYAKNESIGGSILGSHAENHGEWGTALGGCSNVTVDYGVALGAFSTANTSSGIAGYDPSGNSADNSSVWNSSLAAVSIGDSKEGYTRQITNVAAGTEDTDVVNVAQLKSLGKKVETDYAKVDASNLSDQNVTSWKTKLGVSDLTSTLLTYKANGKGNQTVSLATGLNFTNGENTTASIDANGVVKYDVNKELKNMTSISGKEGEGKISFGKDAKNNNPTVNVNNSRITGVANAIDKMDAVNKGQLDTAINEAVKQAKADINVKGEDGISVQRTKDTFTVSLDKKTKATLAKVGTGKIEENNQNTVTGDTVYKAIKDLKGDISAAKTEVKGSEQIEVVKEATSDGHDLYKVKAKTEELKVKDGKIEKPTKEKALVTAGNIAKVIEETELTTTVKSGSKNITVEEKKIGNNTEYTMDLAKDISVDSIKIGDKISISKSGINAGKQKITNVADGKADSDAANMKQLRKVEENAKKDAEKLGNAINHNAQKIHDLKKEVGNVGALSSAMAALNPMEYDPMKPNQVLAGVGSYKNSQAVAVGMSHHFNENLRVQAGVSFSEGRKTESMVNLGLAWKIGKDDRDDSYNKYKEGPISSIYVLQDEVIFLKQANQKKDKEIDELKMLVKKLMSEK